MDTMSTLATQERETVRVEMDKENHRRLKILSLQKKMDKNGLNEVLKFLLDKASKDGDLLEPSNGEEEKVD